MQCGNVQDALSFRQVHIARGSFVTFKTYISAGMFRLFRLLTKIQTFVGLLETITKSAPQAMASVVLTFIVIFIFSAVGTRMFTYVKEGNELDTTFNNFSNFLLSLIAMFRVSSGSGWSVVLSEAGV
jgi:hypothetical protein